MGRMSDNESEADPMSEDSEHEEVKPGRKAKVVSEAEKSRTVQNAEIAADMDDKIAKRLEYIQKQTDLLMHFEPNRGAYSKAADPAQGKKSNRGRMSEKAEDEALLKRAETETGDDADGETRLTIQPTVLENGTLREYQLEGLNWLVRTPPPLHPAG